MKMPAFGTYAMGQDQFLAIGAGNQIDLCKFLMGSSFFSDAS